MAYQYNYESTMTQEVLTDTIHKVIHATRDSGRTWQVEGWRMDKDEILQQIQEEIQRQITLIRDLRLVTVNAEAKEIHLNDSNLDVQVLSLLPSVFEMPLGEYTVYQAQIPFAKANYTRPFTLERVPDTTKVLLGPGCKITFLEEVKIVTLDMNID